MLCSFWAIIPYLRQNVNSICVICAQKCGRLRATRASRRPLHIDKYKWRVLLFYIGNRHANAPCPGLRSQEGKHLTKRALAKEMGYAASPAAAGSASSAAPSGGAGTSLSLVRSPLACKAPSSAPETTYVPSSAMAMVELSTITPSPSMKTPSPESWMYTADAASYVPSRSRSEISQSVAFSSAALIINIEPRVSVNNFAFHDVWQADLFYPSV